MGQIHIEGNDAPPLNLDEARANVEHAEKEIERAAALLAHAEDELKAANEELKKAEEERRHKVFVSASTTSGFWPPEGFIPEAVDTVIMVFLEKAKSKLGIVDTAGWVARAGDRVLDVSQSSHANGLMAGSEVVIDWGPDHGGGGTHA